MTSDRYMTICKRILERCQQKKYYGPDGGWQDYRGYFDDEGKLQIRRLTHDPHTGFEFPPATEEQLQRTEETLGFPLPPMLRALYTHVANGGFGPAYGITGARGGYYFGEDGHYQTIDGWIETTSDLFTEAGPSVEYIDLAAYERQHGNPLTIELPANVWPARFLRFCYEGCGEDVCIDGGSGRVYLVGGVWDEHKGLTGYLRRLDNSVENWLERWLFGEKDLWVSKNICE